MVKSLRVNFEGGVETFSLGGPSSKLKDGTRELPAMVSANGRELIGQVSKGARNRKVVWWGQEKGQGLPKETRVIRIRAKHCDGIVTQGAE